MEEHVTASCLSINGATDIRKPGQKLGQGYGLDPARAERV